MLNLRIRQESVLWAKLEHEVLLVDSWHNVRIDDVVGKFDYWNHVGERIDFVSLLVDPDPSVVKS